MSDKNHPNQVNIERIIKTKIVCTLGPATENKKILEDMIVAGMDMVRLNFSHGEYKDHEKLFNMVRELSTKYEEQVSILCDVQGPKIRTGKMKAPFDLKIGDMIKVTPEKIDGTPERITITYEHLIKDLDVGDVIFINDGVVKLIVKEKLENDLLCETVAPGPISDKKGCNIPKGNLSIEIPTKKDKEDLAFIAKLNPEYVAASFIEKPEDVIAVRECLKANGNTDIKIISKIERPDALKNIDAIIAVSDAIMVARGDLGVEIPLEDVPVAQKDIVRRCNHAGKTVIVATQMLESMIENSRPTRAEANDVFNAVLDGTDAVMLSGETSVGKFPVDAVKYMDTIVATAEKYYVNNDNYFDATVNQLDQSIGSAVRHTVEQFISSKFTGKIICITSDGLLVRMVSKFRPQWNILAFTENLRLARELNLTWATRTVHVSKIEGKDLEEKAFFTVKHAVKAGLLSREDHVLVLSGSVNPKIKLGIWMGIYRVQEVID